MKAKIHVKITRFVVKMEHLSKVWSKDSKGLVEITRFGVKIPMF